MDTLIEVEKYAEEWIHEKDVNGNLLRPLVESHIHELCRKTKEIAQKYPDLSPKEVFQKAYETMQITLENRYFKQLH